MTAGPSTAPLTAADRTSERLTVTTPGVDWLFDRLEGWGDHPAIVRDDGVWSYGWLVGVPPGSGGSTNSAGGGVRWKPITAPSCAAAGALARGVWSSCSATRCP